MNCEYPCKWLDKSADEIEKEQAFERELERKAERRVIQGRLAMYLYQSDLRDDILKLCGVSTDVELMSLIVDEIEYGE